MKLRAHQVATQSKIIRTLYVEVEKNRSTVSTPIQISAENSCK